MVDMKNVKKFNNRVVTIVSLNAFLLFAMIGGSCENDVAELKKAYFATSRR